MCQITANTNLLISNLNEQLKTNCPDLQLTISQFGADFKLRLLKNGACVSLLTISDQYDAFSILSQTNDEYQGRGYNKFLTAVSIYLADTMTKHKELFSSTSNKARIHILSQYDHRLKEYEDQEDEDEDEDKTLYFFISINKNKDKAINILTEWIQNKCVKNKANVNGGKKTRRNKQRRKNKTQRRKSKKRKTKRL